MPAGIAFGARGPGKTGGNVAVIEILDIVEAEIGERLRQFVRGKEADPGLADRRDARRIEGKRRPARRVAILGRLAVVEHDLRAGEAGNVAKRGKNRFARQVGHEAQPDEEARLGRFQTSSRQFACQTLAFEIDRHEGGAGRLGKTGLGNALALPGLRRRMIDLKDREVGIWIAQRKSVEAGANDDDLADAAPHCRRQPILSEAVA